MNKGKVVLISTLKKKQSKDTKDNIYIYLALGTVFTDTSVARLKLPS